MMNEQKEYIYSLSKLLFALGWRHELVFSSEQNIWRFDAELPLLIHTSVKINHCNVDYVLTTDHAKLQKIVNRKINFNDLNAEVCAIYGMSYENIHTKCEVPNLPITLYRLRHHNLVYKVYTDRFRKTGLHSLAITLCNLIVALQTPPMFEYLLRNATIYNG